VTWSSPSARCLAAAIAAGLTACSGAGPRGPAMVQPKPALAGALVGPDAVAPYVVGGDKAPAAPSAPTVQTIAEPPEKLLEQSHGSTVHPGDTIRITRDYSGDQQTFVVQPDGRIFYPLAGAVDTRGKAPDQVAADLSKALTATLASPEVTVNILASPSNRIYIGGEVHTPGFLDLSGGLNVHEAVFMAGGLLDTADEDAIALARFNPATDRYDVYFLSFSALFDDAPDRRTSFLLQRDDILFVPKSSIGSAIETVDLFINRLLPFGRGIGVNYVYTR
jgi:protein involved in polysaccharide export with SLBB domain